MKPFLEYVAEDILSKYGSDLSRLSVVFPNKRASLFLNQYLAQHSDHPIWTPAYVTISDLFRQYSSRNVADPIKLVCDLHKSFTTQTGIDETLDHFFGWGQVLLSDFDDLDKNMADADKVFANLRDIHELDDVSYLTEQQKEVIRKFFSNFSDDHNTLLKERFLKLWSKMGHIYHDFNSKLAEQNLAYEGALYREVAENLPSLFSESQRQPVTYLFVGFNLLQPVEQRLFSHLKKEGRARFYWDYDTYYMNNHEASHFIKQYLDNYPNELPADNDSIYRCFEKPKLISMASAPTENIQARYVSKWLKQGKRIADGKRTAIVLCNENLLPMVVHALPDAVEKVNITTGYPIAQSPVASLINLLVNLPTSGYNPRRNNYRQRYVNQLMHHPYIECVADVFSLPPIHPSNAELLQWIGELLQQVARRSNSQDPLMQEAVFRGYTLVNRLLALINDGDLRVDITTLQRLVSQLIQATTIPFHGEPAEGLQIMGMLETRNMDFDHILLLSCNEGYLPRGISDTSIIPNNIRKAYGLTTIEHKVAVYAYHFHRMLQRASDIEILYNNATTDGQKGEMSRFLLQLMVEDQHHHIDVKMLKASQTSKTFRPQPVQKTPEMMKTLSQRFAVADNQTSPPKLSPTAINRYMRCQLMFYYNYVHNLFEPDNEEDETIDNRIFGNIFHEAARILYAKLTGKSKFIQKSDIDELLKTKVDIERAVDEALHQELFANEQQLPQLNGLQLINREVLIHYLRQLLKIDAQLAPFAIEGLECEVSAVWKTAHIRTTIGGRIDRLDRIVKDGQEIIRVIDYKTGGYQPKPLHDIADIFDPGQIENHSDYYLQSILYALLVRPQHPNMPVVPALLFIQHAGGDDYNPVLKFGKEYITDVAAYRNDFGALLRQTVNDIFNPDTSFVPTSDITRCQLCPYKNICSL